MRGHRRAENGEGGIFCRGRVLADIIFRVDAHLIVIEVSP